MEFCSIEWGELWNTPFRTDVWGTVWTFAGAMTSIGALWLLYRTLKSQRDVQNYHYVQTMVTLDAHLEKIRPYFNFDGEKWGVWIKDVDENTGRIEFEGTITNIGKKASGVEFGPNLDLFRPIDELVSGESSWLEFRTERLAHHGSNSIRYSFYASYHDRLGNKYLQHFTVQFSFDKKRLNQTMSKTLTIGEPELDVSFLKF